MGDYINNKVFELRRRNGATQEEFAESIGVSRQTIIAIEKGNYIPSLLLGMKIAKFFKKPVEEIFTYKYENKFIGEIIISLALIGLLVFFINPFDLLMPHILHPFMAPFLVVLFIIFAGLLWKEKPGDEREQLHKFIASRFSYFAVIATLIIGVVLQSAKSEIDPWLVIAICVALLAKILGLIYGNFKH